MPSHFWKAGQNTAEGNNEPCAQCAARSRTGRPCLMIIFGSNNFRVTSICQKIKLKNLYFDQTGRLRQVGGTRQPDTGPLETWCNVLSTRSDQANRSTFKLWSTLKEQWHTLATLPKRSWRSCCLTERLARYAMPRFRHPPQLRLFMFTYARFEQLVPLLDGKGLFQTCFTFSRLELHLPTRSRIRPHDAVCWNFFAILQQEA